jgi:hypothetical protein
MDRNGFDTDIDIEIKGKIAIRYIKIIFSLNMFCQLNLVECSVNRLAYDNNIVLQVHGHLEIHIGISRIYNTNVIKC